MIKCFEEFIKTNESFWKSGIQRSKTDVTRMEDRIESNLYDLRPVDLDSNFPFYVADDILTINGDDFICYGDFCDSKEQKEVEQQGWRLITPDELYLIKKHAIIFYEKILDGYPTQRVNFTIRGDEGTIHFNVHSDTIPKYISLWSQHDDSDKYAKEYVLDIFIPFGGAGGNRATKVEVDTKARFLLGQILLVKDKDEKIE